MKLTIRIWDRDTPMTYENLKQKAKRLQAEGQLRIELTNAERADWAYGNAFIENDRVTRGMAMAAVERAVSKRTR